MQIINVEFAFDRNLFYPFFQKKNFIHGIRKIKTSWQKWTSPTKQ